MKTCLTNWVIDESGPSVEVRCHNCDERHTVPVEELFSENYLYSCSGCSAPIRVYVNAGAYITVRR